MMKKFAVLAFVLQVLVLPLFAADAPKECSLCVGAVANLSSPPATVIPLVLQMRESDLATTPIDSLSAEQRAKLTLNVSYAIDPGKDPLTDVETIKAKRPEVEVHIYPGAQHGFHCDERASYDKASADIAWPRSLAFFAKHLK